MDVFKAIDIEKVVTIILITCLILGVIFLIVSGVGLILHVRLAWAMVACIVSLGLSAICAFINALLNYFY